MNMLVSVIVPIYNVEKYLDRCVLSLINQTYRNLEIILVDDESPDSCPIICDEYSRHNSNIIVVHKKNGGLGDARNYGVKHATGDWIVFVDSDDYVEPEYVSSLMELKNQFNADMAITRVSREKEDGTKFQSKPAFNSYKADTAMVILQTYAGIDVGVSACCKLFPKWVLEKHPFPKGYHEDLAIMYRIFDELHTFAIGCYGNIYHYISRDNSILHSVLDEKHLAVFEICDNFSEFVNTKYPDIEVAIPMVYKRVIVEMLCTQKMDNHMYGVIFKKYRAYFRKKFVKILSDKRIQFADKMTFLLLCTTPSFFKFIRSLFK